MPVAAQGIIRDIGSRIPRGGGGGGGGDSLERRNKFEDSLTLTFTFRDSIRTYRLDSSVSDFTKRFPVTSDIIYLGNIGTAARSVLYNPVRKGGWDPGFHAFDLYKFSAERARFYNTTRPYTELGYVLGSSAQQIIDLIHTQNVRPYWNASFQYRLINAPGFFKNQKTNHSSYQLTSWYQSPNRRYNNYVVILGNKLQSEENGGIKNDKDYLNDSSIRDRSGIPTKLGNTQRFSRDFFNSDLNVGNRYRESLLSMRQQYDLGRKDSIVTDSTIIPLFYPRLRFEHTLQYGKNAYQFRDYLADSTFYKTTYGLTLPGGADTVVRTDSWKEINNVFSIYQFPDAKNLQQYIKAGIEYQLLNGDVKGGSESLYNFIGHGEYRNRSRNQKWDIQALGRLWFTGYNAGDYYAYISLQRLISNKIGSLQIGFENINRSPSFLFDERSNFYLDAPKSFSKENTIHFFAAASNPALKLQLSSDYYLIANYLYVTDYYKLQQENSLFTILRINALKSFRLSRYWNWYAEGYIQQKTGNVALNLPLLFTRHRLAFEGNFFKNLFLSTGIELRYHTPYKGDNYSPLSGQFFYQDSIRLKNRPDIAAYFHFRIRSFKAYVRAENLNTLDENFAFKRNNLAAPDYPYPGMVLQLGIYWSFVN